MANVGFNNWHKLLAHVGNYLEYNSLGKELPVPACLYVQVITLIGPTCIRATKKKKGKTHKKKRKAHKKRRKKHTKKGKHIALNEQLHCISLLHWEQMVQNNSVS